jgi:cytochrome b561
MNKNNMADIIQDYLIINGQTLSHDQIIVLAKQIRLPMWNWHIYIGYALVGFITIRFSLPFFGEMKFQNPFDKKTSLKEKFQNWSYIIFYVFVIITLVTGLIIELGPKSFKKPMEAIHELSIYYLLIFIFIHLSGVLIAEFTNQKGIISKIVSGGK